MEMGIGGEVPEDAGYFAIELIIQPHRLVDRVVVAKISMGGLFGKHDRVRIEESRSWIAFDGMDIEYVREVLIDKIYILLIEYLVFIPEGRGAAGQHARDLFNFRKIMFEQGAEWRGDGAEVEGYDAFLIIEAAGNPIDMISPAVIAVVAQLIEDIGEYEQATGQSDGQPEEVDEGNELVFRQVAPGDLKIVP